MFISIIQSTIISIIFIFLVHYLVKFFKNTLTTPKIKDFVTLPAQKYKKMFDTINPSEQEKGGNALDEYTKSEKDVNSDENKSSEYMKSELKNFMKTHLTEDITEFSVGDFTPF